MFVAASLSLSLSASPSVCREWREWELRDEEEEEGEGDAGPRCKRGDESADSAAVEYPESRRAYAGAGTWSVHGTAATS